MGLELEKTAGNPETNAFIFGWPNYKDAPGACFLSRAWNHTHKTDPKGQGDRYMPGLHRADPG